MAKIYYLPEPYPDELIGSILIRAGRHLGHSIKRMHSLFGLIPRSRWTLFFQSQLQLIATALSKPPDELLYNHTPFPYVTAFLSHEHTARLARYYCLSSQATSSALSQSVTTGGSFPRYCEACIEDDHRKFGEDYWHRRHNLPFVTRCWKHGLLLHTSDRRRAGVSVIGLPHEQLGIPTASAFSEEIHSFLEPISIALLDSTYRQPPEAWQRGYRLIAEERGFPHHGTLLSSIAIARGFVAYYGKAQLRRAGLDVPSKPNPWPVMLLRQKEASNISVKHILMQVYLQSAPIPSAVVTTAPGRQPLNCQKMDPVFAAAIRRQVSNLPKGSRFTVTDLLTLVDILQPVRHHRKTLPLTAAAIKEFRQTEFSVRKTGRRARKKYR